MPPDKTKTKAESKAKGLTVYYNGDCPVCSSQIKRYRQLSRGVKPAIKWRDVVQYPHAMRRFKVDPEEAKKRLHVVDGAGKLHSGVDAFALLWAEIPKLQRAARLLEIEPLRRVAALVYDRALVPALCSFNAYREMRQKRQSEQAG